MTAETTTSRDYTGHDAEMAYHAERDALPYTHLPHGVNSLAQAIASWVAYADFFGESPRISDLPAHMIRG